jgi:predicted molibdopterin-dependent oxidoreductase YjgC
MFKKIEPVKRAVTIEIDGVEVCAEEGDSVAAVFLRQAENWTRKTALSGERRSAFCMMGSCFECLATVDGVPSMQTCLVVVREGMRVERTTGLTTVS